jgi:hypothetical protein
LTQVPGAWGGQVSVESVGPGLCPCLAAVADSRKGLVFVTWHFVPNPLLCLGLSRCEWRGKAEGESWSTENLPHRVRHTWVISTMTFK